VIEPFRNPPPPSFPKFFIGNPNAFKYLWTPDRGIQGQAKSGSKVAGVTRRWESRGFYQEGGRFNKALSNGVIGKGEEG
jgi:hypothetical protein